MFLIYLSSLVFISAYNESSYQFPTKFGIISPTRAADPGLMNLAPMDDGFSYKKLMVLLKNWPQELLYSSEGHDLSKINAARLYRNLHVSHIIIYIDKVKKGFALVKLFSLLTGNFIGSSLIKRDNPEKGMQIHAFLHESLRPDEVQNLERDGYWSHINEDAIRRSPKNVNLKRNQGSSRVTIDGISDIFLWKSTVYSGFHDIIHFTLPADGTQLSVLIKHAQRSPGKIYGNSDKLDVVVSLMTPWSGVYTSLHHNNAFIEGNYRIEEGGSTVHLSLSGVLYNVYDFKDSRTLDHLEIVNIAHPRQQRHEGLEERFNYIMEGVRAKKELKKTFRSEKKIAKTSYILPEIIVKGDTDYPVSFYASRQSSSLSLFGFPVKGNIRFGILFPRIALGFGLLGRVSRYLILHYESPKLLHSLAQTLIDSQVYAYWASILGGGFEEIEWHWGLRFEFSGGIGAVFWNNHVKSHDVFSQIDQNGFPIESRLRGVLRQGVELFAKWDDLTSLEAQIFAKIEIKNTLLFAHNSDGFSVIPRWFIQSDTRMQWPGWWFGLLLSVDLPDSFLFLSLPSVDDKKEKNIGSMFFWIDTQFRIGFRAWEFLSFIGHIGFRIQIFSQYSSIPEAIYGNYFSMPIGIGVEFHLPPYTNIGEA